MVIGSGATAVTLIPAMADKSAHITMLQRSPSYVSVIPGQDKLSELLAKVLPEQTLYNFTRNKNILMQRGIYKLSRRFPKQMRQFLLHGVKKRVGEDFDMAHFTPSYNPWDERVCAVPDGDFFDYIRDGKASVVTDHIDHFDADGIQLKSGKHLQADVVVSATGLNLQILGGMQLSVDGQAIDITQKMMYKGVLIQDIPNFAYMVGYTNASWTLKVDMAAEYVCRLLAEKDQRRAQSVMPEASQGEAMDSSIVSGLNSGYVKRGEQAMPRQGRTKHWMVAHHYENDRDMLNAPIADPALRWVS